MRDMKFSVNQVEKYLIALINVHYCYEDLSLDIKSFKNIKNMLEIMFERQQFFTNKRHKQHYKEFFIEGKINAGNEVSEKTLMNWLEQVYLSKETSFQKKFLLKQKLD